LLLFFHRRARSVEEKGEGASRALPNLTVAVTVTAFILTVATVAPGWFADPLRGAADPTLNPERLSFPWYVLFLPETLPFFGVAYPLGSLILVGFVLMSVFLLPYLDRNPDRGLLGRPFAMALSAAFLVIGIYFSMMGTANARYGESVFIPEKGFPAVGMRGARVFAEKNCAYCHQVAGKSGRRQGPDMTVVSRRGRSRPWIQRFIHNARLYQPGTAMPRYEIPLEDLEALSVYLLSLDPGKGPLKALDRDPLLEATLCLETAEGENR
jgi:ubiquinol-cytochrome c reductase cytochrome b subunit